VLMIRRSPLRFPFTTVLVLALAAGTAAAQKQPALPARWDELTASDWPKAMERSNQTCILPIGILEKHGMHGPLGSDLIKVRELAARATRQEYAVVFPDYFYGQINEARHQPGTFALPSRVVWDLLEATVDEIGRNGFKRIIIINGHGGNPTLLRYFAQTQLERRRPYALYFFDPPPDPVQAEKVRQARKSDPAGDQHGGENETSTLLYLRPDLVQQSLAKSESGENLKRLTVPNIYTGIWWYASYPNHYAGDGTVATRELGQLITDHNIQTLVSTLRAIKADRKTLELQKEFFDRVDRLGK
jgi:creatinine amidohydrolase